MSKLVRYRSINYLLPLPIIASAEFENLVAPCHEEPVCVIEFPDCTTVLEIVNRKASRDNFIEYFPAIRTRDMANGNIQSVR